MHVPLMDTADVHKCSLIEVNSRHLSITNLHEVHPTIHKMVRMSLGLLKIKAALEMLEHNLSRIVEWKFMLHESKQNISNITKGIEKMHAVNIQELTNIPYLLCSPYLFFFYQGNNPDHTVQCR